MPLYEYRCDACGAQFERIRKFSDPPLDVCPECGKGPVEKLVSSPAFQFKGSGWYITDYARKAESSASGDSADKGGSDKSDKKESTPAETAKPAASEPAAKTEKPAAASGSKENK